MTEPYQDQPSDIPTPPRTHKSPTPNRKPPTVVKKLVFSGFVIFILLLGGEVFCRLFGLGRLVVSAEHLADWQRDEQGRTFWVMRGPGQNRDGLRDRDHKLTKIPGVHRIVFLGDSVTAGHGVSRKQTYPSIFEQWLIESGVSVEVFNVATSGWTTHQERAAYGQIARRYQPDSVFLEFCLNDPPELHNMLQTPPPRIVGMALRHSALVRALVWANRRQINDVRDLFELPDSDKVNSAWEQVFEELLVLREEVISDGASFGVLIFPFRFQLNSGDDEVFSPIPQQRLSQFCLEHKIPHLDLLPALKEQPENSFIDVSHLSPSGAAITAKGIIRWMTTGCVLCGRDFVDPNAPFCPYCGQVNERRTAPALNNQSGD